VRQHTSIHSLVLGSALSLVFVLVAAWAGPAYAADPPNLERYRRSVETVAPPQDFTNVVGRVRCICQDHEFDPAFRTWIGFLNSYVHEDDFGRKAVKARCLFPLFDAVTGEYIGTSYCVMFQLLR
jgi:hypothetical protein